MEPTIIDYLTNLALIPAPYSQIVAVLRVLFLIFSFFLIGLIIYALVHTQWLRYRFFENSSEFFKSKPYGTDQYLKKWKQISNRINNNLEAEYKLAIMEADLMLESILKGMGYIEETVEKKLINVTSTEISNIEELKKVRKARNDIVYDPDYQLSKEKTKEVLDVYAATFKELGLF